jgi:hypothetical protein
MINYIQMSKQEYMIYDYYLSDEDFKEIISSDEDSTKKIISQRSPEFKKMQSEPGSLLSRRDLSKSYGSEDKHRYVHTPLGRRRPKKSQTYILNVDDLKKYEGTLTFEDTCNKLDKETREQLVDSDFTIRAPVVQPSAGAHRVHLAARSQVLVNADPIGKYIQTMKKDLRNGSKINLYLISEEGVGINRSYIIIKHVFDGTNLGVYKKFKELVDKKNLFDGVFDLGQGILTIGTVEFEKSIDKTHIFTEAQVEQVNKYFIELKKIENSGVPHFRARRKLSKRAKKSSFKSAQKRRKSKSKRSRSPKSRRR